MRLVNDRFLPVSIGRVYVVDKNENTRARQSLMDQELAKRVGAAARQARKALGLTQEDAAERINVSVEYYARIERGNSLPSAPTLVRLAQALGVSLDALAGLHGAEGTDPSWPPVAVVELIDDPQLRRIVRRLRRVSPSVRHVVASLVKEMARLEGANQARQGEGFEN